VGSGGGWRGAGDEYRRAETAWVGALLWCLVSVMGYGCEALQVEVGRSKMCVRMAAGGQAAPRLVVLCFGSVRFEDWMR